MKFNFIEIEFDVFLLFRFGAATESHIERGSECEGIVMIRVRC